MRSALGRPPGHREALDTRFHHALSLHRAGRPAEAEAALLSLLALAPEHLDALHLLAILAFEAGQLDQAAKLLSRCIAHAPRQAELHWRLGRVHAAAGRSEPALTSLRQATRLDPEAAVLHRALGDALTNAGHPDEAIGRYERALRLRPDDIDARRGLAIACKALGRLEEALALLRDCVARAPDLAVLHHDLATTLLLLGEWEEGWREYEWRWRLPGFIRREYGRPPWQGEALEGRTLLVHVEQGAGDVIQFCRYLPALARETEVVLLAPAPLRRLLTSLADVQRILPPDATLPPFDLYCALMSLPGLCRGRSRAVAAAPYLAAPPAAVARWRACLPAHGLRVGLAWAGNAAATADRFRSIPPDLLRPLTNEPGATFVSLQVAASADAAGLLGGMLDRTAELSDYAETAALIEALDLVIAVDTSVVHLAGALGKPVWLLNRFDPCWRWGLGRDDTAWYPTLRQFRQKTPGGWPDVLDRVRQELSGLIRREAQREDQRPAPV